MKPPVKDENLRMVFSKIEEGHIREERTTFKYLIAISIVLLFSSLSYIAYTFSDRDSAREYVTTDCNVDCGNAAYGDEKQQQEQADKNLIEGMMNIFAAIVALISIMGLISCSLHLVSLTRQDKAHQEFMEKYNR